jgi:tRNA(Arg) A34 adenosine deaminase TadA
MSESERWMERCIELASESAVTGGGPFGALVVRGTELVATGVNGVTRLCDPTAHAEVQAIRAACAALADFRLAGCELYASTEPCPMCLAAAYWARVDAVYYASTRREAALAGFDDARIYEEIALAEDARSLRIRRVAVTLAQGPFEVWLNNAGRTPY